MQRKKKFLPPGRFFFGNQYTKLVFVIITTAGTLSIFIHPLHHVFIYVITVRTSLKES
jgi:hypothetical protein